MRSPLPSKDTSGAHARDLFRDTSLRWTVDAGPLAGTILDIHVHADGSVEWRIVAGPDQGRLGRARSLVHAWVRDGIASVWLPLAGDAIFATLDLAARRFSGFHVEALRVTPIDGVLHAL